MTLAALRPDPYYSNSPKQQNETAWTPKNAVLVSFEAGTIKRARTATGIVQQKRFLIPYQLELANELNIERFQLIKAGQIQFSHPDGTHDDRAWGIALAMFATRSRPVPQFKPITRVF